MTTRALPTTIDSRRFFQIYGVAAGLAGIIVAAWGPEMIELPAAWVRVCGAMLMAASCASFAITGVDDPEARRKAAGWFMLAHGIVIIAVVLQFGQTTSARAAAGAAQVMTGVLFVFYYFWRNQNTAFGNPRPLQGLFVKNETGVDRLRTRYEEQIRMAASQEERHRLARDLHDSVKQQLFVIQTAAATAQARFDGDAEGALEAIDQVRSAAREAIAEMQAMLDQLRAAPLENTGLVEALRKQAEALGFRTGAQVHFQVGALPPNEAMTPGSQEAMFRVAQEALANIARHARARNVWLSVDAIAGQFRLEVRDDGSGFDANKASAGMGIANMRTRAREYGGTFEIGSRPGDGTSITLSVPYTVIPFVRYGRNALLWSVALLIYIVAFFFKPNAVAGWVIAIIGIECARHTLGYLRTRGAKGAAA